MASFNALNIERETTQLEVWEAEKKHLLTNNQKALDRMQEADYMIKTVTGDHTKKHHQATYDAHKKTYNEGMDRLDVLKKLIEKEVSKS